MALDRLKGIEYCRGESSSVVAAARLLLDLSPPPRHLF